MGHRPGQGSGSRERGSGAWVGRGRGPGGWGKLPHVRCLILAQTLQLLTWNCMGGGGLGFIAKAIPELGRGKRAQSSPRAWYTSVGRSGRLELLVLSPISEAGAPGSSLGFGGTCRNDSQRARWGEGSFSLWGGPALRTIPTLLWLPGRSVGMKCGCGNRTPLGSTDLARVQSPGGQAGPLGQSQALAGKGQKPAPAPAHTHPEKSSALVSPLELGRLGPWVAMGTVLEPARAEPPSSRVPLQLPGLVGSQDEGPQHLS